VRGIQPIQPTLYLGKPSKLAHRSQRILADSMGGGVENLPGRTVPKGNFGSDKIFIKQKVSKQRGEGFKKVSKKLTFYFYGFPYIFVFCFVSILIIKLNLLLLCYVLCVRILLLVGCLILDPGPV